MGRTALYRDPIPFTSARTDIQVDADALIVRTADGRPRRYSLDGCAATVLDGCRSIDTPVRFARGSDPDLARTFERRFVRMLVLEPATVLADRKVIVTPPEHGAVAPNVVRVPEAPSDAAVVEASTWEAIADWVLGGGRLAACAIADLARLATIATSSFAALIGEVAAQRALELAWAHRGPLRSGMDVETSLQPLADAARHSTRAGEALVSALAHTAGATRRRRKLW
jgi:hypothetical protein